MWAKPECSPHAGIQLIKITNNLKATQIDAKSHVVFFSNIKYRLNFVSKNMA